MATAAKFKVIVTPQCQRLFDKHYLPQDQEIIRAFIGGQYVSGWQLGINSFALHLPHNPRMAALYVTDSERQVIEVFDLVIETDTPQNILKKLGAVALTALQIKRALDLLKEWFS